MTNRNTLQVWPALWRRMSLDTQRFFSWGSRKLWPCRHPVVGVRRWPCQPGQYLDIDTTQRINTTFLQRQCHYKMWTAWYLPAVNIFPAPETTTTLQSGFPAISLKRTTISLGENTQKFPSVSSKNTFVQVLQLWIPEVFSLNVSKCFLWRRFAHCFDTVYCWGL